MIERLTDALFPQRCVMCDKVIAPNRKGVCPRCAPKLIYVDEPRCLKCGRPTDLNAVYCNDCERRPHNFIMGSFPFSYESIGDSIFRFKYNNRPEYAQFYADAVADRLGDWITGLRPDALIPIPLHKKRLAERGYNQAAELSDAISQRLKIPSYPNLAVRFRNTIPQKQFDAKMRQINMKKAFIIRENDVRLKRVFIVDDIFTTGSTIDSLASELQKNGVDEVYFVTISAAGT